MGTVQHLAKGVEQDLAAMLPAMFKSPRKKLTIMIAALIEARSCNTMELAARLPIETERAASRYTTSTCEPEKNSVAHWQDTP